MRWHRAGQQAALFATLLTGLALAGCSTTEKDAVKPTPVTATANASTTNFTTARGVNIQFSYYPDRYSTIDFARIRREGFTAVRIEIDPTRVDVTSANSSLVPFGRVLRYVREARQANLDVVLTYHNSAAGYSGANSSDHGAKDAGDWWAKAIPKLEGNGYAYTINVINEWGKDTRNGQNPGFASIWVQNYNYAVDRIHNAGYQGPIIIDASSYASDSQLLLDHGLDISTNGHKLIFSLHIYPVTDVDSNDLVALNAKFDNANYNYGMIIGEFGSQYDNGRQENRPKVQALVQNAIGKGWGAFGWAWLGDGDGSSTRMNADGNTSYRQWLEAAMGI